MVSYYRRYIGDFQRKTAHLNVVQIGQYNTLLDWQYAHEKPLPRSKNSLVEISKTRTAREKKLLLEVVEEFFPEGLGDEPGDRWNPRVIQELTAAHKAIEKMSEAGKRGAERRWGTPHPTPPKPDRVNHGVSMDPPTTNLKPKPTNISAHSRQYTETFERAWKAYPKRAGGNPKRAASKAWAARVREGADVTAMLDGARRYAEFCLQTDKIGSEYVKQAASFFGPEKHYLEQWEIPPKSNGADKLTWGKLKAMPDHEVVDLAQALGVSTRGKYPAELFPQLIEAHNG